MFKYNVQVMKVSGRLNESVLPSKNLVVKSKTEKTDKQIFAEASKYFKKKYGLVIESLEVTGFDGEEPSGVTTGNTQGGASFTKSSDEFIIAGHAVKKGKWFSSQFGKYDMWDVMSDITEEIEGKKVHYCAEDNESTGVHNEFTETSNEVRKFTSDDSRSIIDAIKEECRNNTGGYVSVNAIINDNELEIRVTQQYSGDWVKYKERWTVSL
jgi:hypothetical protein